MRLLPSLTGFLSCQNSFSSIGWRRIFCFLVLAFALATVGCWNRLGQDAEVSEENEKIAAQVKVAIVQESGLNAAPIDIKVRNGVVRLGGFVEDEPQRQAVEKAAGRVTGVASVINNIQIK